MEIRAYSFRDLDPAVAYDVWRLRQDVFVVEQECAYADLDGRDTEAGTVHVVLWHEDRVAGYARVLDEVTEWRIGRVVLDRSARGRGLADAVMRAALEHCTGRDVVLSAQSPLAGWYGSLGFVVDGPGFDEDGIPHTPMRLRRS